MKRASAVLAAGLALAICLGPGVARAGPVWTSEPVPLPANAGQEAALAGVSCVSPARCIAVGQYTYQRALRKSHALAEYWDGSAWTVQHLAKPGSTWSSSLDAITCRSARDCTAVGAGPAGVLIERWNGQAWAVQPTPPLDGGYSALAAVACA